jgi:hypothetical protein
VQEIPLLLALLLGLLLGLAAEAYLRNRASRPTEASRPAHADTLTKMLLFGAFAMGVFVTYVLLGRM